MKKGLMYFDLVDLLLLLVYGGNDDHGCLSIHLDESSSLLFLLLSILPLHYRFPGRRIAGVGVKLPFPLLLLLLHVTSLWRLPWPYQRLLLHLLLLLVLLMLLRLGHPTKPKSTRLKLHDEGEDPCGVAKKQRL